MSFRAPCPLLSCRHPTDEINRFRVVGAEACEVGRDLSLRPLATGRWVALCQGEDVPAAVANTTAPAKRGARGPRTARCGSEAEGGQDAGRGRGRAAAKRPALR